MNPMSSLVAKINQQNLWDKTIELERNEYLKVRGSIDTNVYFILSGTLRIFVMDDFEEYTIRFGYQDNLIAALDSFISERPSEYYIQALKKTTLHVLSKSKFKSLVMSSQENTEVWLIILENLVSQQLERECDLLTISPIERYTKVLGRSPQLFQEIPGKYIASYLRMTPETFSRIKKS